MPTTTLHNLRQPSERWLAEPKNRRKKTLQTHGMQGFYVLAEWTAKKPRFAIDRYQPKT